MWYWMVNNNRDRWQRMCEVRVWMRISVTRFRHPLLHSIALHWMPIPMPMSIPTHTHGFWVGMGAILSFMGGHGWGWVLCIPTSNSKSGSNFSDVGNTLTKKRFGLKPTTTNDFLFVRSNQDLVSAGNTHYTIFEYMGGHWSLLMVMIWVWVQIRRKMLESAS